MHSPAGPKNGPIGHDTAKIISPDRYEIEIENATQK
jgi:hypothetical protein